MQTAPDSADEGAQRPGIAQLIGQLAADSRDFARAEIDYLRAEAGERANIAIPALALIVIAIVLIFAALVALLVGLVWLVAPMIGAGWALLLVTGGAVSIALLLIRFGTGRLKRAFKGGDQL